MNSSANLLTNQRYLVLPHTTIQTELTTLSRDLAPQIDKLLKRADILLEAEKQKLEGIENTIKILKSNPTPTPAPAPTFLHNSTEEEGEDEGDMWSSKTEGLDMKGLSMSQIKKINLMRNKRKRLEDERAKLGLV
jgi:DASH complex subunit SPC19